MPRTDLSLGELATRDHAFYGLIWASTTILRRVDQALARAHDLPMSWFEVMLWLKSQPEPIAASDLGAKTLLSRSQVSRVADALHARGLVERTAAPGDGRSVLISLTAAGHTLFAEADDTRRAVLAEPFDERLDERDIEDLERIWAKLKAPSRDEG